MSQTILVVDDSDFVRNYHSSILQQANFNVITALDGSDGLEKLYSNPCDLVITDLNMTHMDGYEFIKTVRAEERYQDLPIVIVSTEGTQADKMRGFEAGANLYIVKPCEPSVMIENIRLMLSEN